jgi:hypothetical protein
MNSTSTPNRIELSKYTPSEVMGIARSMQGDIKDRILQGQPLQERLAWFKFRDEQGYYWAVEPRTLTWQLYAQGRWSPGNTPRSALEGPAYQAITPVPLRKGIAKEAETAAPNGNPIGGFANGIMEIKMAYENGQITSAAAEGLTAFSFLVDKNMRLWTVGFQSAAWYFFDAGHWNRASQPLDASQLSTQSYNPDAQGAAGAAQGLEQARAKLVELAKTGVLLPEPVAAPFNPPPDSPAPVYAPGAAPITVPMSAPVSKGAGFCPNCGGPVAPGASFCGVCGYPIGGKAHA